MDTSWHIEEPQPEVKPTPKPSSGGRKPKKSPVAVTPARRAIADHLTTSLLKYLQGQGLDEGESMLLIDEIGLAISDLDVQKWVENRRAANI